MSDKRRPPPYRFVGGYQDPTGLYHFAARYCDPNIGRFTTPDPSGQEQNPYLYAEGDPVNRIDPEGLHSCWSWLDTPCSWLQDNLGDQDDSVIITGTTTIGSMGGSWGAYYGFMAGIGLSIGRNLAD